MYQFSAVIVFECLQYFQNVLRFLTTAWNKLILIGSPGASHILLCYNCIQHSFSSYVYFISSLKEISNETFAGFMSENAKPYYSPDCIHMKSCVPSVCAWSESGCWGNYVQWDNVREHHDTTLLYIRFKNIFGYANVCAKNQINITKTIILKKKKLKITTPSRR